MPRGDSLGSRAATVRRSFFDTRILYAARLSFQTRIHDRIAPLSQRDERGQLGISHSTTLPVGNPCYSARDFDPWRMPTGNRQIHPRVESTNGRRDFSLISLEKFVSTTFLIRFFQNLIKGLLKLIKRSFETIFLTNINSLHSGRTNNSRFPALVC